MIRDSHNIKKLLKNGFVRAMEAHDAPSARVVMDARSEDRKFDAIWASSLTGNTVIGEPDKEVGDLTGRLLQVAAMHNGTNGALPIIFDADSGGSITEFKFILKKLQERSVSAVIIEDKCGEKSNSLSGAHQNLANADEFSEKIRMAKESGQDNGNPLVDPDFAIIARIEGLIYGETMDQVMERARKYIAAGADGIMIHSKEKTPDQILEFTKRFKKEFPDTPLVLVPTTYMTSDVKEDELRDAGANMIIYGNHMLRAAITGMKQVANEVLKGRGCVEVDKSIHPIEDLLGMFANITRIVQVFLPQVGASMPRDREIVK